MGALLLVCGFTISDFFSAFWLKHAMFTNIASSLLIIVLGIAVIEEWLKEAEEQRWHRVSNICLKALAQTVIHTRDGLKLLGCGTLPFPEEHAEGTFDTGIKATVDRILGVGGRPGDLAEDLEVLMCDEEWVREAYTSVRALSRSTREALAEWAPLMLASDRLCEAVDRVGHMADALEDLHRPLGPAHRTPTGIDDAERRVAAAGLYDLTLTFTIALEEWLASTTGRPGWKTRGRVLLSRQGTELIVQFDDRDDGIEEFERQLSEHRDAVSGQYLSAYETASRR